MLNIWSRLHILRQKGAVWALLFIWESILTHTAQPPAVLPGMNKLRCTQATIEQIHDSPPGIQLNTEKTGFVLAWRSAELKFIVQYVLLVSP